MIASLQAVVEPKPGFLDLWEVLDPKSSSDLQVISSTAYEASLKAARPEILALSPEGIHDIGHKAWHVVFLDVLRGLDEGQRRALINRAWSLVKDKGKLTIVSPNPEAGEIRGEKAISLGNLKDLLYPLGKPKVSTSQPYRWLSLSVRKIQREDERPRNSTVAKRIAVTADLCHGRVLEFGCGRGELAKAVRDRGLEVTAVDKNDAKIELAADRYPDITFICHDVLTLDLEGQLFDTVMLPEILEHVPEPLGDRMLARAWQALKQGGRLIVTVPNRNFIPHPNHVRVFDKDSLAQSLARFGQPVLVTDQPYKWLIMYVDGKLSPE